MGDVGDVWGVTQASSWRVGDLLAVHGELGGHRLHLFLLLAQVRLVDRQLLGDLGPRLARQDRLELDVELLLLLDELILRRHLLGLADQRLLQRVRPLDHRVGGGVRPLELAPAVDVHLLVELLRQRAHLCTYGGRGV